MATAKKSEAAGGDFLTYKGKPLVRDGKFLYYGDPAEPYILMLQIKDEEALKDLSLPTRVSVTLMDTDPEVGFPEKFVKTAEKDGIFNALDVGMVWLDKALRK